MTILDDSNTTTATKRKHADTIAKEEPPRHRARTESTIILHDTDLQREVSSSPPDADHHTRIWRKYLPTSVPPKRPILPSGRLPIVWAATRSELCESMPWFRSYQAGVYSHDGLTHGYLLAAAPAPRDAFLHDGKVIISHGGGGSEMVDAEVEILEAPVAVNDDDSDTQDVQRMPGLGKMKKARVLKQTKDQVLETGRVRPLLNSYKNVHPVLLVAHRQYALFPYELSPKMTYVVLGWYFIASMWEEAEPDRDAPRGYLRRTKLKFQWIDAQGEPWWHQHTGARPFGPTAQTKNESKTTAPRKVAEMTLTRPSISPEIRRCDTCSQPARQVYEQGWMCLEPRCRLFWRIIDLGISPHGDGLLYHSDFVALEDPPRVPPLATYTHLSGWCAYCGRLSCRRLWEAWVCDCCGVMRPANMILYSAHELDVPVAKRYTVHDSAIRMDKFAVRVDELQVDRLAWVHRFVLPFDHGIIYHVLCPDVTRNTVDELLERSQREIYAAASFRRHTLGRNRIEGMLTQYFSQNYGARYKFVAETETTIPLHEAQSFVNDSLKLILDRAQRIFKEISFNEVLVAAYMGKDQMNYHSDSEPGLRGDIGTLSLGSPAQMMFRPIRSKAKNVKSSRKNPRRKCLTLNLRHGDVLLMHGIGIQQNYEHTVIATGMRIAATARYIDNR